MSTSTWTGAINNDWADAGNWSPAGVPGASSDVTIATGAAVASAPIGTVNSITDSSDLSFESTGTNTVATFLDDAGHLRVDANAGEGGTILNIGGTLTNSNHLHIGNATLSASDKVKAAALDNTGKIYLTGSSANQALLDVSGSAGFGTAGVLSGDVRLVGDSAIEFPSGEITSLAANAILRLNGSDAFIEDSKAPGSNSALTGLASIGAGAIFALRNKAAVSTSGSLANNGTIRLDFEGGVGGSSLTLAEALTNSGSLSIGNKTLSAADKVTAASLDNTGLIQLTGSRANQALLDAASLDNTGIIEVAGYGANQALLNVTGNAGFGAAGTLTGIVNLSQGAIEFLSGQISTIAAGSEFALNGNDAFVEDSTALGSNSALTGLADIAGILRLYSGASLSTTGSVTVTNSGAITIDFGGSTLSIAGGLTNSGYLEIALLSSSSSVTAKSFVNSGTVDLTGNGTILAALNVSGATTNNGSISIATDTEKLAGPVSEAVGETGSFNLSNANLQFDSSVSAGQTINESGADALVLDKAQSFAATISGFGTGDTIDAANFLFSGTTYNFVENSGGTGTLTLTDKGLSLTANILMNGHYTNSDFTLAPDSGTGTLVKFV
jgi:hypothetical protein